MAKPNLILFTYIPLTLKVCKLCKGFIMPPPAKCLLARHVFSTFCIIKLQIFSGQICQSCKLKKTKVFTWIHFCASHGHVVTSGALLRGDVPVNLLMQFWWDKSLLDASCLVSVIIFCILPLLTLTVQPLNVWNPFIYKRCDHQEAKLRRKYASKEPGLELTDSGHFLGLWG